MVSLCKYHVLSCPDCGHLRTSSSNAKTACPRCGTSWQIREKSGETVGVIGSFWRIEQARDALNQQQAILDARRAAALKLGTALATLGLRPGCTSEDFAKAYRAKAMDVHPDQNPNDPGSEARMRQINEAAECVREIMGWQ